MLLPKYTFSLVFGLIFLACSSPQTTVSADSNDAAVVDAFETSKNKQAMFATILVHLHEGQEATYDEYIRQAKPLFHKHGITIERGIKPLKLARGTMELPHEILIFKMESANSFPDLNADPTYRKLVVDVRDKAISKGVFIPCSLSDFEFTREVGGADKTFGMAFLNYAPGKKAQFDDYHEKACAIIPEFGAHFERFLVPTGVKGDFPQPDEIHLFFFDTPEGMQQMGSDPRMQNLFPQRDEALSSLNFLIGKATI